MGTVGELSAWVADDALGEAALAEALRMFDEVSALMATFGDTDVTRINRFALERPVAVSPLTYEVLQRAQRFAMESNGLFDITFAALAGVWELYPLKALPARDLLTSLLRRVDYRAVTLTQGNVRLSRAGTVVSLNGIAKGFAVDRAVAAIRALGARDFILRLGGDLFVSGRRGDRRWKIGVRDPRGDDSFAELEVENAAFSTSGDYERFAFLNGVRYHHILDPRTGYPATASRAVSVLAPDATTAEGLTKILFIGGKDDALLARYPGSDAIGVTAKNEVWMTGGIRKRVRILHVPGDAK